jgi:hypothetical protein
MLFADDWGGALADVMAGLFIAFYIVAVTLIFYWVVLVPLSYGYYTWKEYLLKGRQDEMDWRHRLCGFLFSVVVIIFVTFPTIYYGTATIWDIAASRNFQEDVQLFLTGALIGTVLWILMEMMLRIRWQRTNVR